MIKPMLERMARYNRWANARLYDACAQLTEPEYMTARPAFFGSIHRTLNHILVGDRIWLGRVTGHPLAGVTLDAELYPDLPALRVARTAEDERIVAVTRALPERDLAEPLAYRTTAGEPFETGLATVLQHMFNHQTHHRGQVHGMLSATAVPPPPLDLIYYVRQTGDDA
jgi:uncharacterized damage-inducible protein DinB